MGRKKSNKVFYLVMLGEIVLFLGIIAFVIFKFFPSMKEFGASGKFQEETVTEMSEEIVSLFSQKEYEKIMTEYADAALQESADASDLENEVKKVKSDWGEFKEITDVTLSEMKKSGDWYAVAEIIAIYENITVTYTFTFNESMELSGVYAQ